MKVYVAPYILKAQAPITAKALKAERNGALLKFEWSSSRVGYADCLPWPELGDEPLARQLHNLSQNVFTLLTRQSLYCAELDGQARENKINLFRGIQVPDSHFLVPLSRSIPDIDFGSLWSQGYRHLKLKLPASVEGSLTLLQQLQQAVRDQTWSIRLDSNLSLTAAEAMDFATQVDHPQQIEFWEDPTPYDPAIWRVLNEILPLAIDRAPVDVLWAPAIHQGNGFQYLIHKPAIQTSEQIRIYPSSLKIVVTSYLDHPVGQCFAAYQAAHLASSRPVEIGGLQSHLAYETTEFSERLGRGAPFVAPEGSGFGFDDLLEAQSWKLLTS